MALPTQYNTLQELLDDIQKLVFQNNSNETTSDNIQKAVKDTAISLWNKAGVTLPSGTVNQTLRYDSSNQLVADPNITHSSAGLLCAPIINIGYNNIATSGNTATGVYLFSGDNNTGTGGGRTNVFASFCVLFSTSLYASIFGIGGNLINSASRVLANAQTSNVGNAQQEDLILSIKNVTLSANPFSLEIKNSNAATKYYIPLNKSYLFEIKIVGIQTGGLNGTFGDSHVFFIRGGIKNSAGTTTLIGTPTLQEFTDAGASTWTAVVTANDATDYLDITVTGQINKTISWTAYLETVNSGI